MFKTLKTATAILVAMLALASPVKAAYVCNLNDANGRLTLFFMPRTVADRADGVGTGTLTEIGIVKNGVETNLAATGQEKIWSFTVTEQNGVVMLPPDLPGLSLVTSHGPATLFHGQTVIANGTCEYKNEKTAAADAAAAEQRLETAQQKMQALKMIDLFKNLALFGAALGTIH